jgi:hypothetical protein
MDRIAKIAPYVVFFLLVVPFHASADIDTTAGTTECDAGMSGDNPTMVFTQGLGNQITNNAGTSVSFNVTYTLVNDFQSWLETWYIAGFDDIADYQAFLSATNTIGITPDQVATVDGGNYIAPSGTFLATSTIPSYIFFPNRYYAVAFLLRGFGLNKTGLVTFPIHETNVYPTGSLSVNAINGGAKNILESCPSARDIGFFVDNAGDFIYTPPSFTVPPTSTTQAPKNIEIITPAYGTTTASTTFPIRIQYKTQLSFDFRPTTTRHFRIVDALTGEIEQEYNVTLPPNTGENIVISATGTVPAGSKYIRAMYLDQNGNPYSEVDEVFFSVATNTYFAATGLLTPRDSASNLSQIDCETFDVGCQFQKALTFLLVPNSRTLDKFGSLWQEIASKKPFGYVSVTIEQLRSLNTTGSPSFTLGALPFMDSIFSPLRDLLAGIIWAVFATLFFRKRLTTLDI